MAISLKSPAEIAQMRRAGELLWDVLSATRERIRPGLTTAEVDAWIEEEIRSRGGCPVMRGYRGQHGTAPPFAGTASICINDEIVHAPPGHRLLREGDLVTIDCALSLEGWCADAAIGVAIGKAEPKRSRLLEAARSTIRVAVEATRPGTLWSEATSLIAAEVERLGFSILSEYAGHGIGRDLHEAPAVCLDLPDSHTEAARLDFVLRPGMVFTIEPILVHRGARAEGLDDGWTVVTTDRSPACHEERTVAVMREGVSLLTG
jgi:methionyl aminopeptidase